MADAYQPGTPGEMGPEFWETLPASVQERYWNDELMYGPETYESELGKLQNYMLERKIGTIEEINFMYDWMALPPAARDPQAKSHPLWNGTVMQEIENM